MPGYTARLIIVVRANVAAAANTHGRAEDEADGGAGDPFRVGLSATGQAPATHYWCSWALRPAQVTNLNARFGALVDGTRVRVFNGNQQTPEQVLTTCGLQRVRTGGLPG
jgi:hypothetical protein